MVSLFTIVSLALTVTISGVFGQCPPNLTGLATSGVSIADIDSDFIWGPVADSISAGVAVTGQSFVGFAPTFIIKPDPAITTTFTIRYSLCAA